MTYEIIYIFHKRALDIAVENKYIEIVQLLTSFEERNFK